MKIRFFLLACLALDSLIFGYLYSDKLIAYRHDLFGRCLVSFIATVLLFFGSAIASDNMLTTEIRSRQELLGTWKRALQKSYLLLLIIGLAIFINPVTFNAILDLEKLNIDSEAFAELEMLSALKYNQLFNIQDKKFYNIDHVELRNNKASIVDEKGHRYSLEDAKFLKGKRKLKDSEKKILEKFNNTKKVLKQYLDLTSLRINVALIFLYHFILILAPFIIKGYAIGSIEYLDKEKIKSIKASNVQKHSRKKEKIDEAFNEMKRKIIL